MEAWRHSQTIGGRVELVGSTAVAGALALAAGAVWAALLSTESLLAEPLSVPGSMAAGLLLASSYPAWSLSRFADVGAIGFPALLLLVSFSELLALHHDVEASVGVDWQVFYLPVLLVTVLIGRRTLWDGASTALTRTVLRVAAVGWTAALLIEGLQWRLGEVSELHAELGTVKDAVEVLSAVALFVALSMLDSATSRRRLSASRGQAGR
jgi:hypothetical protein